MFQSPTSKLKPNVDRRTSWIWLSWTSPNGLRQRHPKESRATYILKMLTSKTPKPRVLVRHFLISSDSSRILPGIYLCFLPSKVNSIGKKTPPRSCVWSTPNGVQSIQTLQVDPISSSGIGKSTQTIYCKHEHIRTRQYQNTYVGLAHDITCISVETTHSSLGTAYVPK